MKATFILFSSIPFIGALTELVMNFWKNHPIIAWSIIMITLLALSAGVMVLQRSQK